MSVTDQQVLAFASVIQKLSSYSTSNSINLLTESNREIIDEIKASLEFVGNSFGITDVEDEDLEGQKASTPLAIDKARGVVYVKSADGVFEKVADKNDAGEIPDPVATWATENISITGNTARIVQMDGDNDAGILRIGDVAGNNNEGYFEIDEDTGTCSMIGLTLRVLGINNSRGVSWAVASSHNNNYELIYPDTVPKVGDVLTVNAVSNGRVSLAWQNPAAAK